MKLTLYAVRNKEGKFFRAMGYGGGGDSWVDTLDSAKLYTKIGQARSRVTYWFKNYPSYGMPEIVELEATIKGVVKGEVERVKKVQSKEAQAKFKRQLEHDKRELERAFRNLEQAQADILRYKK